MLIETQQGVEQARARIPLDHLARALERGFLLVMPPRIITYRTSNLEQSSCLESHEATKSRGLDNDTHRSRYS